MGDHNNLENICDNDNNGDRRKIDGMDIHRDVYFRTVRPTDIPICAIIEKESYPSDEMASLSTLQYRQHHAARYFRCAVVRKRQQQSEKETVDKSTVVSSLLSSSSSSSSFQHSDIVGVSNQQHSDKKLCTGLLNYGYSNNDNANEEDDDDMNQVIGFICSTRCCEFTHESMYSHHDPNGTILAIHSVVVTKEYRHYGIATAMMKDYIKTIIQYDRGVANSSPSNNSYNDIRQQPMIEKIVLLSKANLLSFYVNCGFQVMKPSAITHGKDQWYDLILNVPQLFIPEPEYSVPKTEPTIPCCIVDAFANPKKNGTGNPAAVVVLDHVFMMQRKLFVTAISSDEDGDCTRTSSRNFQHTNLTTSAIQWMQLVANEFNLSETAFVWPYHDSTVTINDNNVDDRNNRHHYYIKYFTPTVEVPLCGHATLASASVMFQMTTKATMSTKGLPGSICFHTVDDNVVLETHLSSSTSESGASEHKQKQQSMKITMNFPTAPVVEITNDSDKMETQQMLSKALRIDVSSILYMGLVPNLDDLLIELAYDSFMELSYDDILYSAFLDFAGRGIIISCLANATETSDLCVSGTNDGIANGNGSDTVSSEIDFYSRFFAPKAGIDEDPVTGSAHCALSVYYSGRLNGKSNVVGYQKSKRSGIVSCKISENGTRVQLTGTAVMAVSGTLWW